VLWFSVGRRYGAKALRLLCRFSLSRDTCVRSTADFFSRRGLNTLLIARFVPGLSVLATPMAGASGVSFSRFIAYAASGDAIWIGTCLFVGYGLADQIGTLLHMLRHFGLDLGGVAMTVILAYVGLRWYSRQRLVRRLRMARISADELAALMSEHVAPGPPARRKRIPTSSQVQ
jgi:membrane protein DedA with SNARE-associated domain